ncbi:MAG: FkbM family methyltransferase [Nitrospinota bacterium]
MNILLGWPIKITYEKSLNLFKVVEGNLTTYIGRRQYLKLYAKGISGRNKLLIDQYLLNDIPWSKDDLVIDVGANVGEVSLILSRDFQCSTYSIEPEEVEFECLKLNLKGYNSTFLNNPLWKEEKQITFYSANEELDSSCFETEDYTHVTEKKTATLSNIINSLEGKRVKLLKLEAEGAEPEILLGGLDVINQVDYICVDVGPERGLSYETTLVDTVNILNNHGFEFIKMGHPRLICLFKNKQIS